MENFSSFGIVIREKLQGESDKLITILTAEHGKVYALARGVKKPSNKNMAGCQLFSYSEFDFANTRGRNVVKTAIVNDVFFSMKSDAERFALACYFADIINYVALENVDETENLRLLLNSVYALAYKPDLPLWLIKGAFELKLMCNLGFKPNFSCCPVCGSQTMINENYTFSFDDASVICDECKAAIKNSNGGYIPNSCTVSHDIMKCMAYIGIADSKRIFSFKLDEAFAGEFSFVCENYLIYKTERTYDTLKVFKSISNSLNVNLQEKNEQKK